MERSLFERDAPWDNLNELFQDMKADPESISVVGTSSPGSMDHIQFVQIAKAQVLTLRKLNMLPTRMALG